MDARCSASPREVPAIKEPHRRRGNVGGKTRCAGFFPEEIWEFDGFWSIDWFHPLFFHVFPSKKMILNRYQTWKSINNEVFRETGEIGGASPHKFGGVSADLYKTNRVLKSNNSGAVISKITLLWRFIDHYYINQPKTFEWNPPLWLFWWKHGRFLWDLCGKQPIGVPKLSVLDVSRKWGAQCVYYINMFAANPRFARVQSRISFDMLKPLRRVLFFTFQNNRP